LAIAVLSGRGDPIFLTEAKPVSDRNTEGLRVEQAGLHQLQSLLQQGARLHQLRILRGMKLHTFHIPVLLLQSVTDLQQGPIERAILQVAAKLQRLMDVLF
jgi:hypothetical protein